jgi:MoxR-like ATPase
MTVDPLDGLESITTPGRIVELQRIRSGITVALPVREYIADLVGATRSHPKVRYGASPRGSLGLMKAAQGLALIRGRDFVIPDDVKELAPPVLTHRIIMRHEERAKGFSSRTVMEEILARVPVSSPA